MDEESQSAPHPTPALWRSSVAHAWHSCRHTGPHCRHTRNTGTCKSHVPCENCLCPTWILTSNTCKHEIVAVNVANNRTSNGQLAEAACRCFRNGLSVACPLTALTAYTHAPDVWACLKDQAVKRRFFPRLAPNLHIRPRNFKCGPLLVLCKFNFWMSVLPTIVRKHQNHEAEEIFMWQLLLRFFFFLHLFWVSPCNSDLLKTHSGFIFLKGPWRQNTTLFYLKN